MTLIVYKYVFDSGEDVDNEEYGLLEVSVMQDPEGSLAAGVGSTVWDCALVMCKYLEHQRDQFSIFNKSNTWNGWRPDRWQKVLELGTGTGIVGLVLSHMLPLSKVHLTDQKFIMPLLEMNAKRSEKKNITTGVCDWTDVSHGSSEVKYDLILVSDCVVWPNLFQPLIDTIYRFSHSGTEILLCYERRDFEAQVPFFRKFGDKFFFNAVPPEEFHPDWKSVEDLYLFRCRLRQ